MQADTYKVACISWIHAVCDLICLQLYLLSPYELVAGGTICVYQSHSMQITWY